MSPSQRLFYLPRTMDSWPWPRAINPHLKEAEPESDAWIRQLAPFNKRSQYAYDKCNFALLAALAYPWLNKDHLRIAIDLMHVFFIIDEYTDAQPQHVVREMCDIVVDALKSPHKPRPNGEVILGEMTRQFWELTIKSATEEAQRHFIVMFTEYLDSNVSQAADRDNDNYRDVDEYMENRQHNIGLRPSLLPVELTFHLPDHVIFHPVIQELGFCSAQLIALDNDILSYNKEQAIGDDRHNLITIVMRRYNLDLQGAVAWVAGYHDRVKATFISNTKKIPSWEREIDEQVAEYVKGLAIWPRGNHSWHYEGGRYFGSRGLEYQRAGCVPLLQKASQIKRDGQLREEGVFVPLVDALQT